RSKRDWSSDVCSSDLLTSEKAIAKNMWAELMEAAHSEEEEMNFSAPGGVVKKIVDPETGMLATSDCEISRATYFEKGTEPTQYRSEERRVGKEERRW